jgi:hypothetical protein
MANMSNYLETQLIQHIFRSGSYSKPSTLAIALSTAILDDTATGSNMSEISESLGYSRQPIPPSDINWQQTEGTVSNNQIIDFGTASESWGSIKSIAIVDDTTYGTGNILFWGLLSPARIVNTGSTFAIDIGRLGIEFDN